MSIFNEDQLNDIDPDIVLNLNANECKYFTVHDFNASFGAVKDNYFMLNLNIQSFHAKQSIFEAFLGSLCIPCNTLVLTETWNDSSYVHLCKIDNYEAEHTFRTTSRGGGVSIFASSTMYGMEKINELSICNETIETCVARIFRKNDTKCDHYIVGVYRPRHVDDEQFLCVLHEILSNELLHNKTIILAGDMNINLLKNQENYVKQYISMLNSLNFIQCITKATRFPNGATSTYNPSCLDHIFINKYTQMKGPIFFADISDHCATALTFEMDTSSQLNDDKQKITFRLNNENNQNKLEAKLSQTDWNFLADISDVDEQFITFQNYINSAYCENFPLKTKFISNKRKNNPWITEQTMAKIKMKSNYYKQYRNGIISKEEHNRLKNRLNKEINLDKKNYHKNIFSKFKCNMKKSWSILHSLLGTKNTKSHADKIFSGANSESDRLQIVNKFNDFFASVGNTLAQQMNDSPNPSTLPTDHIRQSFFIFPPSCDEIYKIIMNLKVTSTSIDELPVKLFKKFASILTVPITRLIENSIQKGIFPSVLKIARITPIHKEESFTDPCNFRPISSLSYLSKVYEKFFSIRLLDFCNKYSIISPHQYGFQHGRSTTDALLNLTENIYSALENKSHFIAAIIDIRKAFDCVNHCILKTKLETYGVRGVPLNWLVSYLTDRKCYVQLGTFKSRINTFNIGVPQGSILGPLLFLIYINNLPKISDTLDIQLFADDTIVSNTNPNIDVLINSTNRELLKLNDWTLANKLTVHAGKTKLLIVSNRIHSQRNLSINLLDNVISPVDHCKYLGLRLDNKMTFKNHIGYVISKISRYTGILYKIRDNLPMKTRLDYYYAYIYPYLSYNTLIWGCAYNNNLQPLIIQQKRALRTITNAGFRDHTDPLFKQLKLLKLVDIYNLQLGIYMYQARNRGEYVSQSNVHTRGHDYDARSARHRLSRTEHAVSYAGPKFWRSLPLTIRSKDNLRLFKKSLKEHLLSKY